MGVPGAALYTPQMSTRTQFGLTVKRAFEARADLLDLLQILKMMK